jgi:Transglycosylase associated protein
MDRSRPRRGPARQYADPRRKITGSHPDLRDRRRRGAGAAATELFHVHTLHGFFNLSTWLTAIVGAAVLLLIFHLINGRSGGSRRYAHR